MQKRSKEILKIFQNNVIFSSWNNSTFKKSYIEAGNKLEEFEIHYPKGLKDFTNELIQEVEKKSHSRLELKVKNIKSLTEKANLAISTHIEQYHDIIGNNGNSSKIILKKFVSYCSTPSNGFDSLKQIFKFSDRCWKVLNDNSTDFSFYTKRLSFSVIYVNSFLYSINDKSNNLSETRDYIKRSIDGLVKLPKYKEKFITTLNKNYLIGSIAKLYSRGKKRNV